MWALPQLSQQDRRHIVRDARDFALINGLLLRDKSVINDNCVAQIPFTLFPSPFPSCLYEKCLKIQPTVNELMLKIANDLDFIEETLGSVVQADDFTRNLLKINKIVHKEGLAQPLVSCISRADYMTDKHDCRGDLRIRQVEVNAIASSMSAHSLNVHSLHNYLMTKYRIEEPDTARPPSFPENKSLALVAEGLIEAFDAYGLGSACILVVCEERSLNFADHIRIELEVHKSRPDIKTVRRRFIDLPDKVKLGPNKELILEEDMEIGLVYYRHCYDPSAYSFAEAWDIRLLLERSKAIKCPSINLHLSGAKKFQQALNNKKQLERFLDASKAKALEETFCTIWSLESDRSNEQSGGLEIGMDTTRNLVLKPQREGGGHNIFGKDVKPFLEKIAQSEEKLQYILMEHIDSPLEKNWLLLRDDSSDTTRLEECDQLVSELGVFGSILADGSGIKSNKSAGYLVRSKKSGVNEGGVSTGYAGISSLMTLPGNYRDSDRPLYYVT